MKRHIFLIAAVILILLASLVIAMLLSASSPVFDGQNAMKYVIYQVALGPRTPGNQAHAEVMGWLVAQLKQYGWQVEIQDLEYQGHRIQNVIAKRGSAGRWVILGAHYDSRMSADHDPDPALQVQAVPGANDGASGVAVLLEIARIYQPPSGVQIWLVFFDAEDQGHLPGWDWILGSRAFVEHLQGTPDQVIILDMVGDADQDFYFESNSDATLNAQIWQVAAALGYGQTFIPEQKYSMLDDHTPFLEKGITAIDIIDFDYPYWHTIHDTVDKISAQSLQRVGDTILQWLQTSK